VRPKDVCLGRAYACKKVSGNAARWMTIDRDQSKSLWCDVMGLCSIWRNYIYATRQHTGVDSLGIRSALYTGCNRCLFFCRLGP